MNDAHKQETFNKVPEVTLAFWIIKIAATTLGETGGDTVTMTLKWGYLAGTALFLCVLAALVAAQILAKRFNRFLYWATIVASTTFGTTMADFADRSLGVGYGGGSMLLFACLIAVLGLWYASQGTISVNTVNTPKAEAFYWAAITFSQTLGTALGDWTAAAGGLGYERGAARICRRSRPGRRTLPVDGRLPRAAVLVRLHSDPAARRYRRRFSRQTSGQGRACVQPPSGLGGDRGDSSWFACSRCRSGRGGIRAYRIRYRRISGTRPVADWE